MAAVEGTPDQLATEPEPRPITDGEDRSCTPPLKSVAPPPFFVQGPNFIMLLTNFFYQC